MDPFAGMSYIYFYLLYVLSFSNFCLFLAVIAVYNHLKALQNSPVVCDDDRETIQEWMDYYKNEALRLMPNAQAIGALVVDEVDSDENDEEEQNEELQSQRSPPPPLPQQNNFPQSSSPNPPSFSINAAQQPPQDINHWLSSSGLCQFSPNQDRGIDPHQTLLNRGQPAHPAAPVVQMTALAGTGGKGSSQIFGSVI